MNVNLAISKSTAEHLANLELDDTSDVDQKLIRLLEAEYRRRLARYRLIDRQLQKKYGMTLVEFEQQQVTQRFNYSWDVESDSIAWETAVDGIRTMHKKLNELHSEER